MDIFEQLEKLHNDNNVKKSISVLSNQKLFFMWCNVLKKRWPISFEVNLSNLGQNRKAWLGAAACCFKFGVTEINTRLAWNTLTPQVQEQANRTAERVIFEFENSTKNPVYYAQTLFGN